MFLNLVGSVSVAGDSLEGESLGECRFTSSEPEPGHAASSEIILPRKDGSAEPASQKIHDNNAAWVAGPSRICFGFVSCVARTLLSAPCRPMTDSTTLGS
jgi:hypothetical protein